MRLNRREFVRAGVAGTAGAIASSCGWERELPPASLDVEIKGLALVQRSGASVIVHLIDGNLVGMGAHEARLSVPADLIDPSSTVAHTPDPDDSTRRLVDLTGKAATIPGTGGGSPNVTIEDTPIGSTVPASDNEWKSIRRSAHLQTLCKASKITDTSKFHGSVQINHGHLECRRPDSAMGGSYLWTFTDPATNLPIGPAMALTDVMVCRTRRTASGPTFMIGNQTLVLVPGMPGMVTVRNLPPSGTQGQCSGGQPFCLDHISVLYDLVDASVKPVAAGAGPPPPPQVDPNYCPPGFI